MTDKNNKHNPRVDEQMGHETQGMVRGGHSTHAEEWRETEPVSTDTSWDPTAPEDPTTLTTSRQEGAPPGMKPEDVEERSALARLLTGVRWPATPKDLVAHLDRPGAPDGAVAALENLPDREYENLADVAEELGYGRESRRF
ncbi:DUF2795 domain-containing protein [Actinomadura kijaniata]|uniref:DUF2795 domain-containing protein n=1 Tax=Actinomadura kijaniata TaxID=46161 RepID=UPI003F1DE151